MYGWVRVSVTVERNYSLPAQATVYKENYFYMVNDDICCCVFFWKSLARFGMLVIRTLREHLRTCFYSIKTQWRIRSASMGKEKTTVECVTKMLFVHTIGENILVESVVGAEFVKALSVRHMATRSTKGTVYVALSICSLFPGKKNTRNYKTKETAVENHLQEKFPGVIWAQEDKPVKDGCSRRRPDLLLDMGTHVVIVEVDENRHDGYDCTCENRRVMEISKDVSHRPVVMVWLNPDGYICKEKGKVPSPWAYTKLGVCKVRPKWKKAWEDRLEVLSNTVDYWMKNQSDKLIEVVELYY